MYTHNKLIGFGHSHTHTHTHTHIHAYINAVHSALKIITDHWVSDVIISLKIPVYHS